jgi:hypothetical protein
MIAYYTARMLLLPEGGRLRHKKYGSCQCDDCYLDIVLGIRGRWFGQHQSNEVLAVMYGMA